MEWTRTHFIFHLVVLSFCGAEHSLCQIWSNRGSVIRVGEHLFCRCNNVEDPAEIRIITYPIVEDINTTIVDNNTIETKIMDFFEKTEIFTCGLPGKYRYLTAINTIHVIPLLDVTGTDCFLKEREAFASCHFRSVGSWHLNQKTYSVTPNNSTTKLPCTYMAENKTIVICNNIPVVYAVTTNNLTLEMEYYGDVQMKKFNFDIRNIIEASLVPFGVQMNVNNRACLLFNSSNTLIYPYRCIWNMIPLNPMVKKMEDVVTNCIRECPVFNCMKEPLKAYQPYLFHATCGYVSSSRNQTVYMNYTSLAMLPDRAPRILPNGFFHAPDSLNQLYIFWTHLKELEWNGPKFTYSGYTKNGKKGEIRNNNTALFREWDHSLSDTVYIRSKNSMGYSVDQSELRVRSLIISKPYLPKNLRYDPESKIFRWDPPTEQNDLLGYTVYWCNASKTYPRLCHEKENSLWVDLPLSQHKYHFPNSMYLSHIGVSANYSDHKSGGMKWLNMHSYSESSYSGSGLSWSIVPVAVSALIVMILYVYRRCRQMADIQVVLPEFFEIMKTASPHPTTITIPGHISPEEVMDISVFLKSKETPQADGQQDEESPYLSLGNTRASQVTGSQGPVTVIP